ncbi:hypothetical protein FKV25_04445, partial [Lysobacter aestuarii]
MDFRASRCARLIRVMEHKKTLPRLGRGEESDDRGNGIGTYQIIGAGMFGSAAGAAFFFEVRLAVLRTVFLAAFFAGFLAAAFLAAFFTVFLAAAFLAAFFTVFLAAAFLAA